MAYMTKDGRGPYPCSAGEYCGNHLPGSYPRQTFHESPEDAEHQRAYFARMRFGRPRPCEAGTTAEREAKGWVGLYLKEDEGAHAPGDVLIPTPDELREPATEPVAAGGHNG